MSLAPAKTSKKQPYGSFSFVQWPRMGPTFKLCRPSRKPSGESWGDSRGTHNRTLGAKPPIFHYISPRIPPRFSRRPPGRPPKLKCGAHPGPISTNETKEKLPYVRRPLSILLCSSSLFLQKSAQLLLESC